MPRRWSRSIRSAVLLAPCALTACGIFDRTDQGTQAIIDQRLVGMPIGDFIDDFGAPRKRSPQLDGTTTYFWASKRAGARAAPRRSTTPAARSASSPTRAAGSSRRRSSSTTRGRPRARCARRCSRRNERAGGDLSSRAADMSDDTVLIVGAGIGGLTLALGLHARRHRLPRLRGAAEIAAARRRHQRAAARDAPSCASSACSTTLERVAVVTREAAFFNRFGQLVYSEPAGRWAGHDVPQLSIHRADLHGGAARRGAASASAPTERRHRPRLRRRRGSAGADRVRAALARPRGRSRSARSRPPSSSPATASTRRAQAALSRRGTAALLGRQHVARRRRARAVPERRDDGPRRLALGRQDGDLSDPQRHRRRAARSSSTGSPSSNAPSRCGATGTRAAASTTSSRAFEDWHFDWLDVAALIRSDRDRARLPDGRPGPAAALELRPRHAARRRGAPDVSARLERCRPGDPRRALPGRAARRAWRSAREALRRLRPRSATRRPPRSCSPTAATPPDTILREVHERSGDKPFARIEDVVSREELAQIADDYRQLAGLPRTYACPDRPST